MSAKYAPEPWVQGQYGEAVPDATRIYYHPKVEADIHSLPLIAEVMGRSNTDGEGSQANADRIVQCVNGCKGIPSPETMVPELVTMVCRLRDYIVDTREDELPPPCERDAEKLLAKLEGVSE